MAADHQKCVRSDGTFTCCEQRFSAELYWYVLGHFEAAYCDCGPLIVFAEEGSTLDQIIKKSVPLGSNERARVIESTPDLATAHKEAATQGDTSAPQAEDDVDLHYVCFAKGNDGALWELDGRRKGPIRRGQLEENEDVLSAKGLSLGPLKFLEREGADLRFSAVALAGSVD